MSQLARGINSEIQTSPGLEFVNVTPAHQIPGVALPEEYHLVTANQPLQINRTPTQATITLERALTAPPDKDLPSFNVCVSKNMPVTNERQIWIHDPEPGMHDDEFPIDADEFNRRLQESPKPDIKFVRSPENPGLLLAHRSIAFGRILVRAIQSLPSLQGAEVVPTGTREGAGIHRAYPQGVLLAAVVHPAVASFEGTESNIRRLAQY